MKARFLEVDEVQENWAVVSKLLKPVVDKACHGEFTLDDLLRMALSSRIVIFMCSKKEQAVLAAAFEFRTYPKKEAMNCLAVGGRLFDKTMRLFFGHIKAWAAQMGVDHIEASCSPAMERLLKRYGYKPVYRQVQLDLKRGEEER